MVTTLELLDQLEALDVRLAVTGGRLNTDAPPDTINDNLADAIRAHRDLLVAIIRGRTTGHALAPCSTCSKVSMVAISTADGKPRKSWPTCRMTPGCDGRHEPRPGDAERCEHVEQAPQAAPPRKRSTKRFLGDWPSWPTREVS